MKELLRSLPPVHELQHHPAILKLQQEFNLSNDKLTLLIQTEIQNVRNQILGGELVNSHSLNETIVSNLRNNLNKWNPHKLKRVINATGTILHTNLGRARLSEEAIQHVVDVAKNYSNLEYDLESGTRGSRHAIVEELIREVTGAESAMVVNNNAAAVYFILRAFAKGKEIIISRGELVEIGGSFRVSSIMEESDAEMVEVGTTNKTHVKDYEQAITTNTAMILKVHTSNYKIVGFTESVERTRLIQLAKEKALIYYEDLGSGALYDFMDNGIGNEPVVREVLNEGAPIVSFSGDKLLGGPQAGIIAGKKELIDILKKHQLARVLRVDKMTLAALEVTLKAYAKKSNEMFLSIPTIRDILKPMSEIEKQVNQFFQRAQNLHAFDMKIKKDVSVIGGGTMPTEKINTIGIVIHPKTISSAELEQRLRQNSLPVIGRFHHNEFFLDFRTLTDSDMEDLFEVFAIMNQELEVM